ncbi:MAG: hypothetical protein MHPSP_004382, partial [Paramarteilia canceri]
MIELKTDLDKIMNSFSEMEKNPDSKNEIKLNKEDKEKYGGNLTIFSARFECSEPDGSLNCYGGRGRIIGSKLQDRLSQISMKSTRLSEDVVFRDLEHAIPAGSRIKSLAIYTEWPYDSSLQLMVVDKKGNNLCSTILTPNSTQIGFEE